MRSGVLKIILKMKLLLAFAFLLASCEDVGQKLAKVSKSMCESHFAGGALGYADILESKSTVINPEKHRVFIEYYMKSRNSKETGACEFTYKTSKNGNQTIVSLEAIEITEANQTRTFKKGDFLFGQFDRWLGQLL